MKKNKSGFTLVELVIVIAVIAVLAGVLLPTFSNVIENAKESARYQQAVNAEKELIGAGNLPEDVFGYFIEVDNHYYQIIKGKSLQKVENVDENYLMPIEVNISNSNVHIFKYKAPVIVLDSSIITLNGSNFENYFTFTNNTLTLNTENTLMVNQIVLPPQLTIGDIIRS